MLYVATMGFLESFSLWRDIGADKTVLNWIKSGVPIIFNEQPEPFFRDNHKLSRKEVEFVDNEISDLLLVGAVDRLNYKPDFISPLGVVPKKNKKLRLIHDLRNLNDHCVTSGFQYEDIRCVEKCVKSGDQLVTLDIKNGFHHIPINIEFRDYFGFSWRGEFFHWCVLPFGWCASPYFFGKTLKPVIKFLRSKGIRLVLYVDDFLILAQVSDIFYHKDLVIETLTALGWNINYQKSDLEPSHSKLFLGYIVNTESEPYLEIPSDKCKKLKKDISRILVKQCVQARVLARAAGLCISVVRAVGPGKLMLRGVYRLLSTREHWGSVLVLSPDAIADLSWWCDSLDRWNGFRIKLVVPDTQIVTDASPWGYGATCNGEEAAGFWSRSVASKWQNYREMMAILVALHAFEPKIHGKAVQILTDNFSAMTYINHGGGPSAQLTMIAKAIYFKAHQMEVELSARFLAGRFNGHADRLSRLSPLYEWSLRPRVFQFLDRMWGPHQIDRFASATNAQLPVFNTRYWEPGSAGVDALAQNWQGVNNYINPPFRLLDVIVEKLSSSRAPATIIAPFWPSQSWCQRLLTMITVPPVRIPKNSLTISAVWPAEVLRNPRWRLYAWRISGDTI